MKRLESLQLVLLATRWPMQDENRQELDCAAAQVKDWDSVIELASENGVIPPIARSLRDCEPVPLQVRRELYRRYFERCSRNALFAAELGDILDDFERAGIDVLAYKGPALAAMAYGDLALRHPSEDLDLLLRKSDISQAKILIQARGYRAQSSEAEQHHLKYRYHLHFERQDPEIHVELHWAITPVYWPFTIDPDHLWGRARNVAVSGRPVQTLNAECAVLALCAHGAKEGWPRLRQILDLARLIQSHPELDWDWVLEEARRMRRGRVLRLGLWLVHELIGTPIPESAAAQIRKDRVVAQLGLQIKNNLATGRFSGWDFHRYALRVWHNSADQIRYLAYLFRFLPGKIQNMFQPSEKDRDFVDLSALPPALYILVRPLRVMYQFRDPRLIVRKLMRNL